MPVRNRDSLLKTDSFKKLGRFSKKHRGLVKLVSSWDTTIAERKNSGAIYIQFRKKMGLVEREKRSIFCALSKMLLQVAMEASYIRSSLALRQ